MSPSHVVMGGFWNKGREEGRKEGVRSLFVLYQIRKVEVRFIRGLFFTRSVCMKEQTNLVRCF